MTDRDPLYNEFEADFEIIRQNRVGSLVTLIGLFGFVSCVVIAVAVGL